MVCINSQFLSGGGAANFDYVSERFVLLGIVSGSAEEEGGTKFFPNVYARLSSINILDWIYKISPESDPGNKVYVLTLERPGSVST